MKRSINIYVSVLVFVSAFVLKQMLYAAPVDYVNPYIGNISHLLVPTFPTVQLPNSMLRVYPERADYTSEYVNGLPVVVTHHRERSAFRLLPQQSLPLCASRTYDYDNEAITPYSYHTELAENSMTADLAVAQQSAIYKIAFAPDQDPYMVISTASGELTATPEAISGYQRLSDNTNVYLYIVPDTKPVQSGALDNGWIGGNSKAGGDNAAVAWKFRKGEKEVRLKYGISFISSDQARRNLEREIPGFDFGKVLQSGRDIWNETLGKITVEGASEQDKIVFYTSFYRTFERPICYSEDGRYFSAFDGKVHDDGGVPFYNDDWIWDTYRAAHPLRILHNPSQEEAILASFLRMAEQMGNMWMPTFPEVTGDSRRMNSNHAVASFADAYAKGLRFDIGKAYTAARKGMEEKTLAPWSGKKAGWIDEFYRTKGYIPALREGEEETDPNVHSFEKRQPVAVTLGTSYDQWCLSCLADAAGKKKDAARYRECSRDYRNIYNSATGFFHPKDKDGNFLEPFDYRYSGGLGARMAYGENNGWVYRWDVPHNVADLIRMMGGREQFVANLDAMFAEPLGKGKYDFYSMLPDHTGNVGQFSMANEPSLHVPYLYNYAGCPWKTQKRIRQMLRT